MQLAFFLYLLFNKGINSCLLFKFEGLSFQNGFDRNKRHFYRAITRETLFFSFLDRSHSTKITNITAAFASRGMMHVDTGKKTGMQERHRKSLQAVLSIMES